MITPICGRGVADRIDTEPLSYRSISVGRHESVSGTSTEDEDKIDEPIPYNCRIAGFRVKLQDPPPASGDVVFTLRKNRADTTITITVDITDTSTIEDAYNNIVAFSQGDTICIELDTTGVTLDNPSDDTLDYFFTFLIDSDVSMCFSGSAGFTGLSINGLVDVKLSVHGRPSFDVNANDVYMIINTPGTISNFFVELFETAGNPGEFFTFTFYKNGSPTLLEVVIDEPDLRGSDIINSFSVSKGDQIYINYEAPGSGLTNFKYQRFGYAFTPDNSGEVPYMMKRQTEFNDLNQGSQLEISGGNPLEILSISDPLAGRLTSGIIVKNALVEFDTAPGSGLSRTTTLRKDEVATAMVITLENGETSKELITDVEYDCGEIIDWAFTRDSGSQNPDFVRIGLTMIYDPESSCPQPFPRTFFISHPPSGGNTLGLCNV